jgi:aminoglycoside phosphotransferase (APT) family kinase protein
MSAPQSTNIEWDSLAEYLAEHLPGREGLTVGQTSEIGSGWETDLYAIEIKDRDGFAEQHVLRLYRGPEQRAQATEEYRLMQQIAELGIPVPQVHLLATDNSPLGDAFIMMEHIAGPTLLQKLAAAPEAEVRELLHEMITLQAAIHRLPWKGVVESPFAGGEDPSDFTPLRLAEMWEKIRRYGLDEFEAHMRWLEGRHDQGEVRELSLIHNDYHPENILVRNGELVVIDWAFAEASDFRMDLAWTALLVGVMIGQQYRALLVDSYEQISKASVENFDYFEVLKLTMRMLTIATWLDKTVQIPVHRITREAIQGRYKVHVLNPYRRLKQITGLTLPVIEEL